jgi:hypothetical protein
MVPQGISGAWGKVIHEKKRSKNFVTRRSAIIGKQQMIF